MKISIIHPSRSRPELAKKVYDEWMGKAAKPENIQYLLSIDSDDPKVKEYQFQFYTDKTTIIGGENKSAIAAINRAAEHADNDLLIIVSDDFSCPENWDIELLKRLEGKEDFIVKTSDGLQPWIMTLPIMDRVYYNRFGYIYHPDYKHMFCDTEMTHVGDLLGKTVIIPMHFPHRHYSQPNGIRKDEVSVKNDSTWSQGEKLYLERMSRNFDIPESEIKGVLRCDRAHLDFLKQKGFLFEEV